MGNPVIFPPESRCLPHADARDPSADIWAERFSRGASPTFVEDDDVPETGWDPAFYLRYVSPGTERDAAYNRRTVDDYDDWRARRLLGLDGRSIVNFGSCSSGACSLDLDRSDSLETLTAFDINEHDGVQLFVQEDDNDLRNIISRSRGHLLVHRPYWNDFSLYATGFNAPWHRIADDGTCDATCQASVSAWNMFGWQPRSEVLGHGASYDDSPFGGDYGHWLRLDGSRSARLTLQGEHFDLLVDSAPQPASGWTFSAYLMPEADAWLQPSNRGVIQTGVFYVWIEFLGPTNTPGVGRSRVHVGLNIRRQWQEFVFGDVLWVEGSHRGLIVKFDRDDEQLEVEVTDTIVGGVGTDRPNAGVLVGTRFLPVSPQFDVRVTPVVVGALPMSGRLARLPSKIVRTRRPEVESWTGWIDDVQLLRGARGR